MPRYLCPSVDVSRGARLAGDDGGGGGMTVGGSLELAIGRRESAMSRPAVRAPRKERDIGR